MTTYVRATPSFVSDGEMDVRFSTADGSATLLANFLQNGTGGIRVKTKPVGDTTPFESTEDLYRHFALSAEGRWEQVSPAPRIDDFVEPGMLAKWVDRFATSQADNIVAACDVDDPATPETWERWLAYLEHRVRETGASVDRHSHSRPSWRQVPAPVIVDTEQGPVTLTFPDADRIVIGFPGEDGPGYPAGSITLVPGGGSWTPVPAEAWDISRVMHRFDRSPTAYMVEIVLPAIGKALHGLKDVRTDAVAANMANAAMAKAEQGRILNYSYLNLQSDLAHLQSRLAAAAPR